MTKKDENGRTLVEVFIPRGTGRDDPSVFVSVNENNYLLPRGKTSLVPPEVAYEIRRAQRAEERMWDHQDEMESK